MEYSPGDAVPYLDRVPAGVIEMVRSRRRDGGIVGRSRLGVLRGVERRPARFPRARVRARSRLSARKRFVSPAAAPTARSPLTELRAAEVDHGALRGGRARDRSRADRRHRAERRQSALRADRRELRDHQSRRHPARRPLGARKKRRVRGSDVDGIARSAERAGHEGLAGGARRARRGDRAPAGAAQRAQGRCAAARWTMPRER